MSQGLIAAAGLERLVADSAPLVVTNAGNDNFVPPGVTQVMAQCQTAVAVNVQLCDPRMCPNQIVNIIKVGTAGTCVVKDSNKGIRVRADITITAIADGFVAMQSTGLLWALLDQKLS